MLPAGAISAMGKACLSFGDLVAIGFSHELQSNFGNSRCPSYQRGIP
jgi:hypothetical protein